MELQAAFLAVFSVETLLTILLCGLFGLFVGSIPGLTATMAVALIVPVTFYLSDVSAIAAIVTLTAVCIFSGDIPTTLLRIPGTPSSAAYVDDAYALRQKGRYANALSTSLMFSVTGGLFGTLILFLCAPQLAVLARQFGTYEYFWLYALGLSCAAMVSGESRLKGAIALLLGILFSLVGLSEVHSEPRFTFGSEELISGIHFIPALIGLFGVSEVLRGLWSVGQSTTAPSINDTPVQTDFSVVRLLSEWYSMLVRRPWQTIRSCSLGTVIGMIPGAGADIAAWISYTFSKRFSNTPEDYGSGSEEGLADASAANNSSLAGAWIPALVLGIPGDSVTAILIGVLMMKNINPGPDIFTQPEQVTLIYSIYLSFIVANLVLIPIGYFGIRTSGLILKVPQRVLLPVILLFCIVGSYAISSSLFDVALILLFGILGFFLERYQFPLGPVVLGLLLGADLEATFVQNLTKDRSLGAFFSRPLAAALGIICLLIWMAPAISAGVRKVRQTSSRNKSA
ncbi:MAG: tripartite tricarboxylate transporter permease [Planctomycetaceae bacterium]|nr:tripartite tricarboxylate transporter permease [Planctomycetaceae bacterium]